MADIFVSYSKQDKALIANFVAKLEGLGYSVWWDDRLTPKESWDRLIETEIDKSKVVLTCWTPNSRESQWVRLEAGYGKENHKLVPVKLVECSVPLAFRDIQWADLTGWDGDDFDYPHFAKMLNWLDEWIPRPQKESATVSAPPPQPITPPIAPRPINHGAPEIPAAEYIKKDNSKFLEENSETNAIPRSVLTLGMWLVVAAVVFAVLSLSSYF